VWLKVNTLVFGDRVASSTWNGCDVPSSKKKKLRLASQQSTESPAAETLTIGWMLTVITGLACELGLGAALALAGRHPEAHALQALTGLLLFASVVIGLLSLVLLPFVLKLRREAPPLGITVFAVVIGAAPLVLLTLRELG
jgi:hypothetical protein